MDPHAHASQDWRLGRWEAKIKSRAIEIRLILESLGPAYVKIGQALSTRVDIIAEPYALELAKLQADVPPFDTAEARAVLEDGLGRPVDAVFEWLSEEPIASASLGQVGCLARVILLCFSHCAAVGFCRAWEMWLWSWGLVS